MRVTALAITSALAACIATPTLAAKHHNHKSEPALQKAQPAGEDSNVNPYAPGQQRYLSVRQKKS